ncbi:MAG TPA: hypothetical protein VGM19_13585 [Armatimonadota bacterium]|jgi:hypothetical protein
MVDQSVFATGLLNSYCGEEDVRALLVGYDLSGLGPAETVSLRLKQLLPLTRAAVHDTAGRDFEQHTGEELLVDGSGTARLSLLEQDRAPLQRVAEVSVGGTALPAEAYTVYARAAELRRAGGAMWPRGDQNVRIVCDWGYAQTPPPVLLAQAKLTAAQLLAEAAGETISSASVTLGDWSVRYAPGGKYGSVIERWLREATEVLRGYRRVGVRAV